MSEGMIIYVKNNVCSILFTKVISFPHIVQLCDFLMIMQSDVARGQLWGITPAHNIGIPDYTYIDTKHKNL